MNAQELVIDAESVDLFSIPMFSLIIGWTEDKVRSKQKKVWTHGKEYVKTPTGDILISLKGFKEWARQNTQASLNTVTVSELDSPINRKDTNQSSPGALRRKTKPRPVNYILK